MSKETYTHKKRPTHTKETYTHKKRPTSRTLGCQTDLSISQIDIHTQKKTYQNTDVHAL